MVGRANRTNIALILLKVETCGEGLGNRNIGPGAPLGRMLFRPQLSRSHAGVLGCMSTWLDVQLWDTFGATLRGNTDSLSSIWLHVKSLRRFKISSPFSRGAVPSWIIANNGT